MIARLHAPDQIFISSLRLEEEHVEIEHEIRALMAKPDALKTDDDRVKVWSLSSFNVSPQLLKNKLNQVSSVSLLMTSSTALANEGLFELTRHPSLTWAVLCHLPKLPGNQVAVR